MRDLTIIGAGPAGLSAAVYGASEGMDVVALTGGSPGGQAASSSRVENYLGFEHGVSGGELMRAARGQAIRLGAVLANNVALGVHAGDPGFMVATENGIISTRAVLLSMGVQYRRLDVPGEELGEVEYGLDPEHDCSEEHVCIVGGANSAGQAALHAARHARLVRIIARSPLSKSMSHYLIERIVDHERIVVHEGQQVARIESGWGLNGEGHPLRIHLSEREPCEADRCCIFIGATPRTAWLPQGIDRDPKGFIITHDFQTSVHGIFAAGDVRLDSIKRIISAAGEGAAAITQIHNYLAKEEA